MHLPGSTGRRKKKGAQPKFASSMTSADVSGLGKRALPDISYQAHPHAALGLDKDFMTHHFADIDSKCVGRCFTVAVDVYVCVFVCVCVCAFVVM